MNLILSISKAYMTALGFAVLMVILIRFLRLPRLILDVVTEDSQPDVPEGMEPGQWEKIVLRPVAEAGDGFFETLFFLLSIFAGAYLLIGAWLVFKAAVWWMVWREVVQVPPRLADLEEREYLAARSQWGAWIARLLLTGTAMNFVIAAAAGLAGYGLLLLVSKLK